MANKSISLNDVHSKLIYILLCKLHYYLFRIGDYRTKEGKETLKKLDNIDNLIDRFIDIFDVKDCRGDIEKHFHLSDVSFDKMPILDEYTLRLIEDSIRELK